MELGRKALEDEPLGTFNGETEGGPGLSRAVESRSRLAAAEAKMPQRQQLVESGYFFLVAHIESKA